MKASHKERWETVGGIKEPVLVKPGQFITGRFALHREFYPRKKKNEKSPVTVWNWMQTLENMQNLSIKTCNKFSIITIVNWETYQGNGDNNLQPDLPQTCSRLAADLQQTCTNKNDKELKETIYTPPADKNVPYADVVNYLNEVTGKLYKSTTRATRNLIAARFKEGFTLDDFKDVIDHKNAQWAKDPKMVNYIRPETLFGPKFDSYLNEIPVGA
jgi:uncharacterized phage protein (TIGR02220 family)